MQFGKGTIFTFYVDGIRRSITLQILPENDKRKNHYIVDYANGYNEHIIRRFSMIDDSYSFIESLVLDSLKEYIHTQLRSSIWYFSDDFIESYRQHPAFADMDVYHLACMLSKSRYGR